MKFWGVFANLKQKFCLAVIFLNFATVFAYWQVKDPTLEMYKMDLSWSKLMELDQ